MVRTNTRVQLQRGRQRLGGEDRRGATSDSQAATTPRGQLETSSAAVREQQTDQGRDLPGRRAEERFDLFPGQKRQRNAQAPARVKQGRSDEQSIGGSTQGL